MSTAPPQTQTSTLNRFLLTLIRAWDKFWFSTCDPAPASVFRITVGTLIFITMVIIYPNWERFYASNGLMSLDVDIVQRVSALPIDTSNVFYWTEGFLPVGFWWVIGLLASVCFLLGFQCRAATILLFVIFVSMVNRNRLITNGDDLVFRMLMFHAMFAPLDHDLSIDSWWRAKKGLPRKAAPMIWPIRMIQLNVLVVYIVSTPNKFFDDQPWRTGLAIYWTMTSDMWSRQLIPWLSYKYTFLFSRLGTYGSLLIEGLFPIVVWIPRIRPYAIASLVALHIGIAILVPNVAFFTLGMGASLAIFLTPESVRRFFRLPPPSFPPIVEPTE